ncbi:hypothetical protein [Ehrlichia canis]|nr:hypothetical protein [Ehrlichia canis]
MGTDNISSKNNVEGSLPTLYLLQGNHKIINTANAIAAIYLR